ncbi:hypothetical protein CPT_Menos_056 [Burkholderia phage Menos]|uniref:Uncharacterized protein n=1 Tax=Burkholderia phage Menos TaxID=2924900 RepID=A0AAE9G8E1_9CAUD|nr:hypothetical protein CPT_Menos_056 [Burkholderia phage Menos]
MHDFASLRIKTHDFRAAQIPRNPTPQGPPSLVGGCIKTTPSSKARRRGGDRAAAGAARASPTPTPPCQVPCTAARQPRCTSRYSVSDPRPPHSSQPAVTPRFAPSLGEKKPAAGGPRPV